MNIAVSRGEADADLQLSCSITDTGIGIPLEKQSRVFEQFNQLDLSYNRRFGGTGLGLSICRSIAELMRGQISFVSTPGAGSTFTVVIPVKPAQAQARPSGENPAVPLPSLHVLIVDDNDTNLIVAKSLLKRLGQTADTASNGLEAVEAVMRSHYDLV